MLLATDRDGRLDLHRMADQIDVLIASGPNGIYSCGTAGEFYALTEKEFDDISGLLADKCERSGTPFQLGASDPCPGRSLERLKRSVALRPGAIQVILPDWFPVTNEEATDFLLRMAEAARGIGLILYNPPHAKRNLVPTDWKYLKDRVPELVGLKVFDDNGSESWYRAMKENAAGLSVFVPGHRMASGIQNGAYGTYSNVACLNPFAAQRWYEQIRVDLTGALELESRIGRFMETLISPWITEHHYPNHACDRFMANLGGWADVGAFLRWPYRSIPLENLDVIRQKGRELIPEFF